MSQSTYLNLTSTGMVLNATPTEPIKTPTGVLVTRCVETKEGWVGQVIVDKTIVWESEGFQGDEDDTGERKAVKAANSRVVAALTKLFA